MRIAATPPGSYPDTVDDIAAGATFYVLGSAGPVAHIMVNDGVDDVMHGDVDPWPTRTALRLTDSVLVDLNPWEPACARAMCLVDDADIG